MNHQWPSPGPVELPGKHVILCPLVREHLPFLYEASHGTELREAVWKYLPYGPFDSAKDMEVYYQQRLLGKADPLVWTIVSAENSFPLGTTALLAIVPEHGRAEVGHVWLTPDVHRSKANTEAQFLVLRYLFDELCYRRAEWKCDSLNHASRSTATRMGFSYEGRFRQHMWIRGRNRDTDWFSMTNKDWPRCRVNFERWLYSGEQLSLLDLNTGL